MRDQTNTDRFLSSGLRSLNELLMQYGTQFVVPVADGGSRLRGLRGFRVAHRSSIARQIVDASWHWTEHAIKA